MRIVLTESTEGALAEEVWTMYEQAVRHLSVLSVDPQVRERDEFLAMLADTRILKYLAQDDGGAVRGMIAITRHLETISWINTKYFAAREPERYAERRIFYIWIVAMHPDHQGMGGFRQLLEPVAQLVAREDGMIGGDICAYNDATLDLFVRALRHSAESTGREPVAHTLDRLTFYAVTFDRAAEDGAVDGRVINLDAEVEGSGRPNR